MGFRFRKSVKLMPGVRANFSVSKRGLTSGLSGGVKGARVSVNSRGERQTTLSVPGTGISHVTRSKASRSRASGGPWIWGVIGLLVLLALLVAIGS